MARGVSRVCRRCRVSLIGLFWLEDCCVTYGKQIVPACALSTSYLEMIWNTLIHAFTEDESYHNLVGNEQRCVKFRCMQLHAELSLCWGVLHQPFVSDRRKNKWTTQFIAIIHYLMTAAGITFSQKSKEFPTFK